MCAYSKKYGEIHYNPEVWLLYPLNLEVSQLESIIYSDYDGVVVHVAFVDVSNIEVSISDLKSKIK